MKDGGLKYKLIKLPDSDWYMLDVSMNDAAALRAAAGRMKAKPGQQVNPEWIDEFFDQAKGNTKIVYIAKGKAQLNPNPPGDSPFPSGGGMRGGPPHYHQLAPNGKSG
jgi:hypothetical protein